MKKKFSWKISYDQHACRINTSQSFPLRIIMYVKKFSVKKNCFLSIHFFLKFYQLIAMETSTLYIFQYRISHFCCCYGNVRNESWIVWLPWQRHQQERRYVVAMATLPSLYKMFHMVIVKLWKLVQISNNSRVFSCISPGLLHAKSMPQF